MKKTKFKSGKKTSVLITWEDPEIKHKSDSTRATHENDAKLFHDAVSYGKIIRKDDDIQKNEIANTQSKKKPDRYEIDLHGMTVDEAQHYVVNAIDDILAGAKGQTVTIRVITGKGNRSRDRGPQLIHSIHHVVESRFKSRLISIEVSPHELKIGSTYLKGHFDLKIR